jgi:hypothetical protein
MGRLGRQTATDKSPAVTPARVPALDRDGPPPVSPEGSEAGGAATTGPKGGRKVKMAERPGDSKRKDPILGRLRKLFKEVSGPDPEPNKPRRRKRTNEPEMLKLIVAGWEAEWERTGQPVQEIEIRKEDILKYCHSNRKIARGTMQHNTIRPTQKRFAMAGLPLTIRLIETGALISLDDDAKMRHQR